MARGQGTVVVRIVGEIKDLAGKMRSASSEVGQFATSSRNVIRKSFDEITSIITSRFGKVGSEAQKALGGIADKATATGSGLALGVGAGAAVAAAAFVKMGVDGIRAFVNLASQVRSFSRLSGESAETSSRWVGVTKALGIEQDSLARGLAMLNKNVGAHSDVLKKNDVEIARNKNGSVDLLETLLNVSDAYKRAGGGAAGLTIAQAAFGSRMATQLLPILAAGRARVEEFWNAAEQHGELLNDDDLERARQFQVSLRELDAAVKGLEISVGEGLVPSLTDGAESATKFVDALNKGTKPLGGITGAIRDLRNVAHDLNPLAKAFDVMGAGTDLWHHKIKDAIGEVIPFGHTIRGLFGHHEKAAEGADDQAAALDDLTDSIDNSTDAATTYKKALDDLDEALFGIGDAQDAVSRDFEDLQQQADDFAERRASAAKRVADAQEQGARRVRDAEEDLADARQKLNDLSGGSENAAEYMRRYLTGQSGMTDEIANATKRVHDAEQNVADARKDSADAIADSKKQLDDLTRKEADARRAAEQQRDTIRKIPNDVKSVVAEMEKEGKPASEIVAYLEAQRQKLAESGAILGANKQLVSDTLELLKQYEAFIQFTQGIAANNRTIQQRAADTVEKSKNIADKITGGVTQSVVMNVYAQPGDDAETIATMTAQKMGWTLNGL